MKNDQERVQAARNGDLGAYEDLVRTHQEKVYRVALWVLKDPYEARAACIEAFEKAFTGLPKFNGRATFGTWIYRIVLNTSRTRYRKNERHRGQHISLEDVQQQETDDDGPKDKALEKEALGVIRTAVDALPRKLRTAWTLHAVEGFRITEIATIEKCSEGAVKSRLFSARRKLRKSIGPYFEV